MFELLIGTNNAGKVVEYQEMLGDLPVRLLRLADVGLGSMDVDETGTTFEENARLKALAYSQAAKRYTLADDSGICVDALDGRPGLYSARYAGPGADDQKRRQTLLAEMTPIPDGQRSARFICVCVLSAPDGEEITLTRGVSEGTIALAEGQALYGFGYDPVFIPEGYDVVLSEIPHKNQLSHRGRAVQALLPTLRGLVENA